MLRALLSLPLILPQPVDNPVDMWITLRIFLFADTV